MRSLFSVPEDVGDLDLTKVYSHKKDASMGVFFVHQLLPKPNRDLSLPLRPVDFALSSVMTLPLSGTSSYRSDSAALRGGASLRLSVSSPPRAKPLP